MAKISFTYDFFFPREEDGNLSLQSRQQRVDQAVKCLLNSDDYIEFEDGKKCFSQSDLETILEHYQLTGVAQKSQKKNLRFDIPLLIGAAVFLVLSVLFFFCNVGYVWMLLVGIGAIVYSLTKKGMSKSWKLPLILLLSAAILSLAGHSLSGVSFLITIISKILAYGLSALSMVKLSKCIDKKVISSGCSLMAFLFGFCAIVWILVLVHLDADIFYYAGNIVIKITYILLSALIAWLGLKKEDFTSSESHKFTKSNALGLLIALLLTGGVTLWMWQDSIAEAEYEASRPHYMRIYTALENGSIHYGMTYQEIENICGPADNLSRRNGVVEFAYYGGVQLCFDHGRFYQWND